MESDLVDRARSGDAAAFEQLVGPYRRELQVHCYRFLGSLADAEDGLQETLTAAWQAIGQFEGRASVRTWLYRIATSRCLNMLRSASRRPALAFPVTGIEPPEPTRVGEVVWLEPFPDVLLADDDSEAPEGRYEFREGVSLAFITALQLLPPRQRAVLILRDVLDFSAREVAGMLDVSEQSISSALKRARATLSRDMPRLDQAPPAPDSPGEREVLDRFVRAFEAGDVGALVALMTEDVWVRMPPIPLEYQGQELARRFLSTIAFRQGRQYRLVATRANRQPAFGVYLVDPLTGLAHAFGLFVVTLAGERVGAITRFESGTFARFGLPRTLAATRATEAY